MKDRMLLYRFLKVILGALFRIAFRIRVHGINKLQKGPLMLASNHISDLDPIILAITCDRPVYFMAKKELFKYSLVSNFIKILGAFPVDRENADLKSIKHAMGLLREDKVLGIFPEGTRVKNVDIKNLKEGIGLIAIKSKVDIQPVYIETDYKLFRPINVYYRDIISINEFSNVEKKEKGRTVTKKLFNAIYGIKEIL